MATLTAIVVLGQTSVPLARQIATVLPNSTVYGLVDRTVEVDLHFDQFGETVRELFRSGVAIVGICAAGILIRTLAPVLNNKWQEPPVLAIAEDGSAVVPLLGGLHGVNDLARQIATALNVAPAITTTGDLRFRTALLSPPAGYRLANPDQAKTFLSDLLAGATVKLNGHAPWLMNSKISFSDQGQLTIAITERSLEPSPNCLIYHPKTVAIAVQHQADALKLLAQANIAHASIAAVFAAFGAASDPTSRDLAQFLNVPLRFLRDASTPTEIVTIAAGSDSTLIAAENCAIAIATEPIELETIGQPQGKLAIVGTGPGSAEWMSPEVKSALQSATDWVGYTTYLNLAEPIRTDQQRHDSDNREELDRAALALDLAAQGRSIAIVSSGDPGIFAMAAAVFEVLEHRVNPDWDSVEIQVCPGISALQAAAAQVGAPLGHDFCAISLSDILKPWDTIAARIEAAAKADFAIAFYNPVSKQRTWQLAEAKKILLRERSPNTPIVLARNLGRPGSAIVVKPLAQFTIADADMRTVILVGSSKTRQINRNGRAWVYTPRRYDQS